VLAVAIFPEKREVRVIDRPEPRGLKGSEVLLRVLEVGICGTDRELVASGHAVLPPGQDHLVLGHEAIAEVAEVGPDVRWAKKGAVAVPMVRRPCPHARCAPCRAGRPDFCLTGDFTERGIKGCDGFLQELVVEEEDQLVIVPRVLADVAVLTEPLTVGVKAWTQTERIAERLPWDRPRLRTLALGAGPVGLLGAMAMVLGDCETFVYSLDPVTSPRAELVRSFGATYISAKDVPVEELGKRFGPIDLIYEAVGVASVAMSALAALGPNGTFVFTAVPGHSEPRPADTARFIRSLVLHNQVLLGTVNASRRDFASAFHLLEQAMLLFPQAVRALITRRSSLDGAPALIATREGIKQVVHLTDAKAS
jgi:threonine dehydrogenase-like Zn-dependent dehydrogenase